MSIPGLVLAFGGLAAILGAQPAPGESAQFEVASIRPGGANGGRPSLEFTPGGGVRAANATLQMLIQMAYDIRADQIFGGPAWTGSEPFTVVAKGPAEGPVGSEAARNELARQRLQALLAERFHLVLQREAQPASGYVLTVAKQGHTMTLAHDPGAVRLRQLGRWEIRAEGVGMPAFARFLGVHLQAAVLDRTGLEGAYSFHLQWNPELRDGQSVRSFDGLPEDSLIPAVREQLGLRLEHQRVAADRYIIERAEKPAEN